MRWLLVFCGLGTAALLWAVRGQCPEAVRGTPVPRTFQAQGHSMSMRSVAASGPIATSPISSAFASAGSGATSASKRLAAAKGASATARGFIVDETGASVPDGKIRGMGFRHTCSSPRDGIRGAIRNGEFEFRYSPVAPWQVPPGLRRDAKPGDPGTAMSFWVTAPGYAREKFIVGEGVAAALLRGERVRDLTLVLQRGAIVEGTVRGPDGRPVAGVGVYVADNPGARGFEGHGWTDKLGRFRVVDLDPRGRLWIWAKSNTLIAPPVPLLPLYATAVTHQSLFVEQVVLLEPNTSVRDVVTTGR